MPRAKTPHGETFLRFRDALADGGKRPLSMIAAELGIKPDYARAMLSRLRKEMNDAQRAAGFGDWAV